MKSSSQSFDHYQSDQRGHRGIDSSLQRLAQLLLRTEVVPESVLARARRLVRPTSRDIAQGVHTNAVKLSLRRSIMESSKVSDPSASGSTGPSKVAEFDRELDLLRRRHVKHWESFLALLEPLASSAAVANRVHQSTFSLLPTQDDVLPHQQNTDTSSTLPPQPKSSSATHVFHSDSLLPYGPPPILSDESIQNINNDLVWVPRETELLLIRELLLIFQGINSPHIKLDEKTQAYVLHPELLLSPPVRDVVLCLCEVGWLYLRVKGYVDRVEEKEGRGGLVAQAFAFSLQNALNDYYRLLAVLEQELTRSTLVTPPPAAAVSNHTVNEGTSGLTLLRLRAWMLEPLDRMCLMARITDCAAPLAGGGLISRLHGHSFHGDDKLKGFVITLMKAVSVPLYNMITRWVLHGELIDPQNEFFVAKHTSLDGGSSARGGVRASVRSQFNASADFLWHHFYKLNLAMLPSFISSKLAYKILVVGKSINFMKACMQHVGRDEQMQDSDHKKKKYKKQGNIPEISMREVLGGDDIAIPGGSQNDEEVKLKASETVEDTESVKVTGQEGLLQSGTSEEKTEETGKEDYSTILLSEHFETSLRNVCHSYGDEVSLSAQVQAIAQVIETRLLNMVLKKFNLFTHLNALKKFMLLGQGDFVTCLMDTVGGELKRRANQLFRHNLTGLLDGALRSCNAQFEPAYVLERLGVRLLEPSPGDSGWEVFSLDYAIDPPLAAVIHADAISKYRIAFHMLWRLKRVEWALSGAWRNLFTYHHTRGHFFLKKLKPILHRCAVERGKMTHFINSLNNFLMFEVVETAWVKMVAGVERATCLDDIITCHDAYLDEIQERALLSELHEGLNIQIQLVLQAILRFCNLEETMVGDALSAAARKRHEGPVGWCPDPKSRADGSEGQVDQLGHSHSVLSADGTVDGVPGYIIARLEEAAQDYEKQFDKMLFILQEQGETCGHLFRFLTFRLDLDASGQPGPRSSGLHWGGDEGKSSHGAMLSSSVNQSSVGGRLQSSHIVHIDGRK